MNQSQRLEPDVRAITTSVRAALSAYTSLGYLLNEHVEADLTADLIEQLSVQIAQQLPLVTSAWQKQAAAAIEETLQPYIGTPFTQAILEPLRWRWAGNQHLLRQGRAFFPWPACGFQKEWVGFEVIDVQPSQAHNKPAGFTVRLRILTGLAAGLISTMHWSYSFASYLAPFFGFARATRNTNPRVVSSRVRYYLSNPLEYFGLRGMALTKPEDCSERDLAFSDYKRIQDLVDLNHMLMKQRQRVDFVCPRFRAVDELPCYLCRFGRESRSEERCDAACRPQTVHLVTETIHDE